MLRLEPQNPLYGEFVMVQHYTLRKECHFSKVGFAVPRLGAAT